MSTDIYSPFNNHHNLGMNEEFSKKAVQLYNSVSNAARINDFFARLFRRSNRLIDLSELVSREGIEGQSYAGTRVVDIDMIRGSEGRVDAFDSEFHPITETTRDRWLRVARAFLKGETLPPVELIQVGEIYFVRDGHHRISVARSMGQRFIEADITMMRTGRMFM